MPEPQQVTKKSAQYGVVDDDRDLVPNMPAYVHRGGASMHTLRAAHSHPRSRAVAAASVRLRAPNLAIADER
jgi:hypothetical protein